MKNKIPAAKRFEYFASICVMTDGANTFGHTFLLISQLDHAKGAQAKMEVVEAIGFYSRYMPVVGYKPITRGRVKTENPRDIVDKKGLAHKTFPITHDELGSLLTAINEDRRQVGEDKPIPNTPDQYKPGGPVFNLFKGENCKRYTLRKLENLGIDLRNLHGFLEIPKLTQDVLPFSIASEPLPDHPEVQNYYWNSPCAISSRLEKPFTYIQERQMATSRRFAALVHGTDEILKILQERDQELRKQGRQVPDIANTIAKMQKVKDKLSLIQPYPKRINNKRILGWHKEIDKIIQDCTQSLKQKNIEATLVTKLWDTLKEMWYRIRHAWIPGKLDGHRPHHPNSKDATTLSKADSVKNTMRRRVS